MSPNRVFDRSFEVVRKDAQVLRRYGDSIKAYGRDHGGHREGRRNFIEHTNYVDEADGSKRTRVRYNLEGPHGAAFVFAEVSSAMKSGEFVYILVQDKQTGRVITVVDNRAAMTAQRLAGGNKETADAMKQCWICDVQVYETSMHCKYCNKCVGKFDHHCMCKFWMGWLLFQFVEEMRIRTADTDPFLFWISNRAEYLRRRPQLRRLFPRHAGHFRHASLSFVHLVGAEH